MGSGWSAAGRARQDDRRAEARHLPGVSLSYGFCRPVAAAFEQLSRRGKIYQCMKVSLAGKHEWPPRRSQVSWS